MGYECKRYHNARLGKIDNSAKLLENHVGADMIPGAERGVWSALVEIWTARRPS
jgi:hypothetical protein